MPRRRVAFVAFHSDGTACAVADYPREALLRATVTMGCKTITMDDVVPMQEVVRATPAKKGRSKP